MQLTIDIPANLILLAARRIEEYKNEINYDKNFLYIQLPLARFEMDCIEHKYKFVGLCP